MQNGHNVPFLESVSLKKKKRKAMKSVNEALLLTTGVTTLFRDERRTTPLITLALFLRVVILIAGVRKHEKHLIGILFNSFQNKYVQYANKYLEGDKLNANEDNNTCRQTDRHRNVSPDSSDNRNYFIQTTPFIQAKMVQSLR